MVPPLPNTMRRPRAIGLAFAVVGSLVWGVAMQPIKNREGGEVLALGGRRFANRHNNQPNVGSDGGGDIVEGAQPRRNVCGGCFGCVWGGELSGKNKQKLKYDEALNGRKTTNENTTTNQKKAAAMEGTI